MDMELSKCSKCSQIKYLNSHNFNFRHDRNCYRTECKECRKSINKKYYYKNKENILKNNNEYHIIWYQNNKEIKQNKNKIWYNQNKKLINNKNKERLKKDYNFKLRKAISRAIHAGLKKECLSKNKISILKYLPYTIDELRLHIESKFENWMTWDNWGRYDSASWNDENKSTWKWQIDHIISSSNFKYKSMEDDDFKNCWALENLRPYSAKLNIVEGARK